MNPEHISQTHTNAYCHIRDSSKMEQIFEKQTERSRQSF